MQYYVNGKIFENEEEAKKYENELEIQKQNKEKEKIEKKERWKKIKELERNYTDELNKFFKDYGYYESSFKIGDFDMFKHNFLNSLFNDF